MLCIECMSKSATVELTCFYIKIYLFFSNDDTQVDKWPLTESPRLEAFLSSLIFFFFKVKYFFGYTTFFYGDVLSMNPVYLPLLTHWTLANTIHYAVPLILGFPLVSPYIAVLVQYSRMRHLWRHLVFSGLCNTVVCTTYDFLQNPAITKKIKTADLDSFHSLKWHNILHCLSKGLYSESK